jgi:DNA topoisomerase VI subunit A
LVDADGQVTSLAGFYPSVGIPANLAARVRWATVDADRVVCVENLAPFYELIRHEPTGVAALCLGGNPSPACRHLLRCLAASLPDDVPLLAWADIDYGGLTILATLRSQVSPRFVPHRMDVDTLETHARWAHPLTPGDVKNLARLQRHPYLVDMQPLIAHLLQRGLKLEQEAIWF